jgi:UDP-glucose 4-epimerase
MSQGQIPTIFGDGLQSRDFVFVADVVQAFIKAADAKAASGQVYNIGTGRSTNLLELVAALNHLLQKQIQPNHQPSRPGDIRFSQADITKARRDLGYNPSVPFLEGLRLTLKGH